MELNATRDLRGTGMNYCCDREEVLPVRAGHSRGPWDG
jgi:hypothetical protein